METKTQQRIAIEHCETWSSVIYEDEQFQVTDNDRTPNVVVIRKPIYRTEARIPTCYGYRRLYFGTLVIPVIEKAMTAVRKQSIGDRLFQDASSANEKALCAAIALANAVVDHPPQSTFELQTNYILARAAARVAREQLGRVIDLKDWPIPNDVHGD